MLAATAVVPPVDPVLCIISCHLYLCGFHRFEERQEDFDDDLAAGVWVDQLAGHDGLAVERTEGTGEASSGLEVVAAVHGDDRRNAQVAQQRTEFDAGCGVGFRSGRRR